MTTAWDEKTNFTFADAIAESRCEIFLSHSPPCRECQKSPSRKFSPLLYALCFPAKCKKSSSYDGRPRSRHRSQRIEVMSYETRELSCSHTALDSDCTIKASSSPGCTGRTQAGRDRWGLSNPRRHQSHGRRSKGRCDQRRSFVKIILGSFTFTSISTYNIYVICG